MVNVVIEPDDQLLRRVPFLNPDFIKPDGTPASSAFTPDKNEDGLSVDIEKLTTPEKSIISVQIFRLFSLRASMTTELGFENVHDPITDNYAHALIKGKFTRSISRKLAQSAIRVNIG